MSAGGEQGAAESAPKGASRAGRDLRAAITVGVGLGAVILVSLFTIRQLFVPVVAVAVAVSMYELAGALRRGAGINVTMVPALLGGQAVVWLAWPYERGGMLTAFVVTLLVCLIWRLKDGSEGYLRDVTASVFTVAYVAMFASFAVMLVAPEDGVYRVLAFLIGVVLSDTGGYAAGVFFGRHPMAPKISPKKSWEGFAGSLAAGMIGGALTVGLMLDGQWWQGVLFGAALVVTATTGDLVESLIKRDLGIKDMGTLLPGHGGLMDRMDSLLPSAVVAWLLLDLFVPA
ncbi:phosphatidate cytidylyltransferase [Saccharothrix violaceirubra]|uniref:Phosphatidate cytidylyltransferase n=1 Tax=Saccharothrix violaceirubra TaxID=413306 RepID=A0A7W7T0U7_9PSEU|nr:phosphatidate cytidylyltransferase [Saccharothrix violaceirubra]MBB4963957.1 phosphatidate cytidylyltransferase [Saccharothrix violaceirubra]